MARIIRQVVNFKATPHEVYEALMDSRKHAQFTGEPAKISRKVGGEIMASDGYITGTNLELVPDQKIVQSWHASDWPPDAVSKATFSLASIPGGTRLTFTQSGVPAEAYEAIQDGWVEFYWQPLKNWLEATKKS